jgi:hypothetical protein
MKKKVSGGDVDLPTKAFSETSYRDGFSQSRSQLQMMLALGFGVGVISSFLFFHRKKNDTETSAKDPSLQDVISMPKELLG